MLDVPDVAEGAAVLRAHFCNRRNGLLVSSSRVAFPLVQAIPRRERTMHARIIVGLVATFAFGCVALTFRRATTLAVPPTR